MTNKFEPPPRKFSVIAVSGGILTAIVMIFSLNWFSEYLKAKTPPTPSPQTSEKPTLPPSPELEARAKKIDSLDRQSIDVLGDQVTPQELSATKTPYLPDKNNLQPFDSQQMAIARQAWTYFQYNWNEDTGLVNSVNDFPSVTLMGSSSGTWGSSQRL